MSTPRDFLTPEECAALRVGDLVYYDGRVRTVAVRDAYRVYLRLSRQREPLAILLTDAPKVLGEFRPRGMKLADWRQRRAAAGMELDPQRAILAVFESFLKGEVLRLRRDAHAQGVADGQASVPERTAAPRLSPEVEQQALRQALEKL